MKKPCLLIMAAGLGNRYGGLKQIDTFGPYGETLMEYAINDLLERGLEKIVFIIRKYFFREFKQKISRKIEKLALCYYVFQEINSFTEDYHVSPARKKPWGTAHAVLCAQDKIAENFIVINADDFYGKESLQRLFDFLTSDACPDSNVSKNFAMVGYKLHKTLSDYGTVSRAVCKLQSDYLSEIIERKEIQQQSNRICYRNETGQWITLPHNALVSVNLWGLTPYIFPLLEKQFHSFLKKNYKDTKKEFVIPTAINNIIIKNEVRVTVLPTEAEWFGVTYYADKHEATQKLDMLIKKGRYTKKLF